MPKTLTIRNVPDEVGKLLDRLSRDGGKSLNAVVVGILTDAVGVDARRVRLERYATWTPEDAAAFDDALASQRVMPHETIAARSTTGSASRSWS